MTRSPRPRRQNKADRLLCPGASQNEIVCDYACAPFDQRCREMDLVWGIDRLPELVSIETAAKFGSAMAKLNAAIASRNIEETKSRVGVCIRGLDAMNAEARALGRQPAVPETWDVELDNGEIAVITRDNSQWPAVLDQRPDVRVHSLREVAVALKWMDEGGHLQKVREHFPTAEIVNVRAVVTPIVEEPNDDLPF